LKKKKRTKKKGESLYRRQIRAVTAEEPEENKTRENKREGKKNKRENNT
jgi:hypothetical protein